MLHSRDFAHESGIFPSKVRTLSLRPEADDFKTDMSCNITEVVKRVPRVFQGAFVSSPAGPLLSASSEGSESKDELPLLNTFDHIFIAPLSNDHTLIAPLSNDHTLIEPSSISQKRNRDELTTNQKTFKIKKKKRKRRLFSSRKKARPDMIEKFWYVGSDDQGDWLEVAWSGSDVLTNQLAHNLPHIYQPLVAKAKAKGSEQDVSWTCCAGNGQSLHPFILTGDCGEVAFPGGPPPLAKIVHHHKTKWCHLFSLCNVMGASKRKMKKVRKLMTTGCLGDFTDIANQAAGGLGVSLKREEGDVNFVLRQEKGKWLLLKGVHCISVDCTRKLIFDSSRKQALHMTKANLKLCGFHDKIDDLRLVR
jgi:hypothetical protein